MSMVGIDFGNKYIRIFEIKEGFPEIITNELGERRFINLLAFRGKKRYFSYEVENNLTGLLPHSFYHPKDWLFTNRKVPNLDKIIKEYVFQKPVKLHILVILLNNIFKYVKKPWKHCVISLVYPLTYVSKQNIILLIKKLGFNRVTISNDITSLSIAYGYRPIINNNFKQNIVICMFIDIGELGMKIGVSHYKNNEISVLENDTYKDISSYNIQLKIVEYIKKHLEKTYNIEIDINSNHLFLEISFIVLKNLIILPSYVIKEEINYNNKNYDLKMEITRDILDTFLKDWVKQIQNILSLYSTNYLLDKVFLVGNIIRLPILNTLINKLFGDKLEKILHIEESVGFGCALQTLDKTDTFKIKTKLVNNIYLKIDGYKNKIILFKKGTYDINKSIKIGQWGKMPYVYVCYNKEDNFMQLNKLRIGHNNILDKFKLNLYFNLDENGICNLKKVIFNNVRLVDIIPNTFNVNHIDKIINQEKLFIHNIEKKKELDDLFYKLESIYYKVTNLKKDISKIIKLKVDQITRTHIKNSINLGKSIIDNNNNIEIHTIKSQVKHLERIHTFLLDIKSKNGLV